MAAVSQASLLGLPRELRLQIYQYLIQTEIHYTTLHGYVGVDWKHVAHAIWQPPSEEPNPLHVPWIALTRICKTTASELRSMTKETVHATAFQTYELSVPLTVYGVDEATWTKIQCPPGDVKILSVRLRTPARIHTRGDGGPHLNGLVLYRMLHSILHYGPRLQRAKPLERHMRFAELRVFVETDGKHVSGCPELSAPAPRTGRMNYREPYGQIWMRVRQLCMTGWMRSYFERVRLADADGETVSEPRHIEGAKPPEDWLSYGYHWKVTGREQVENTVRTRCIG